MEEIVMDISKNSTINMSMSQNSSMDKSMDTSVKLEKVDIQRLIAQNSDRVGLVEKPPNLKSDVWNSFKIIYVDNKTQNFVMCTKCRSIYGWSSKSGTNSLKRHICESLATQKKRGPAKTISDKPSECIENYLVKNVPQKGKNALNKSIAFGLAKDLKSLHTVEGEGFKHMAQALINFGARYGYQLADDVIQHRTTLRNKYVPELCSDGREKLKAFFESLSVPDNHKLAFSTDLWSEKYQKRNFLSLSMHFIDDDFVSHADMLGLHEIVEKKNTDNITNKCAEILELFFDKSRVESLIETSYAVTDGGSNVLNVFLNQIPCQCHKLNLMVDWTLNERKLPSEEKILAKIKKGKPYNPKKLFNFKIHCPVLHTSFTSVKNIVTYFKQSNLNSKLHSTLKQDVLTRSDSELELLESYMKVKDEVQLLLLENEALEKMSKINHSLLNELIEFLKPIRKCSKTLSGDKYPTMHLVAVAHNELKDEIQNFKPKSEEMKSLLQQAKFCFNDFVVTLDIHYVACMLDPRYRQLKFADQSEREDAVRYLKHLVEQHQQDDKSANTTQQRDSKTACTAQATKRPTRFEKFQDDDVYFDEPEISEVDRYLTHRFDLQKYLDEFGHLDILGFWRDINIFPKVKAVARYILAIPAAETTDERNFSSAGQALTPRRTLLSGESLSELLFIHKSVEAPKL